MARRRINGSEQRGPLLHKWIAGRRTIVDRLTLGPTLSRALVAAEAPTLAARSPLNFSFSTLNAVSAEFSSLDSVTTLPPENAASPHIAQERIPEPAPVSSEPDRTSDGPAGSAGPPQAAVAPRDEVGEMVMDVASSLPSPVDNRSDQIAPPTESARKTAPARPEQIPTEPASRGQPEIHAAGQPVEIDPGHRDARRSVDVEASPVEEQHPADADVVEHVEFVADQPSPMNEPREGESVLQDEPTVVESADETDAPDARVDMPARDRIAEIPVQPESLDTVGSPALVEQAIEPATEQGSGMDSAPGGDVVTVTTGDPAIANIEGEEIDLSSTKRVETTLSAAPVPEDTGEEPVTSQPLDPRRSSELEQPVEAQAPTPGDQIEWRRPTRPRPPKSPPPRPRPADALFRESPGDRSPASWVSRLVEIVRQERDAGAHRRAPETSERSPRSVISRVADEAPSPPSEATRRFLAPRVGIDPAGVTIRRGAQASQVATSRQAEALTQGDEVVIAAGFPEDTPEGLGLLAHELTHVARNRQARFVPPIIARDRGADQPAEAASTATSDEEAIATSVEHSVRREARTARYISPVPASQSTLESRGTSIDQEVPAVTSPATFQPVDVEAFERMMEPVRPAPMSQASREDQEDWGGLPSPWEPMPSWLAPAVDVDGAEPAPGGFAGASNGVRSAYGSVAPDAPSETAAEPAMTAAASRSMDLSGTRITAGDSSDRAQPSAIEPDLDALARQVYAVLKRRLAVERRRIG